MKYCSICGVQLADRDKFCSKCGAQVSDSSAPPGRMPTFTVRKESEGRNLVKWTAIGLGGLLALVIIIAFVAAIASPGDEQGSGADIPDIGQTLDISPTLTFEELVSQASQVTYDELFRNNESYVGDFVHYRVRVVQVIEAGRDKYQLRANVTEGSYLWEDTVFLHYSGDRLLEEDLIEFVGEVKGLITYEAVLGNQITIPEIDIIQARLISKG